MRRYETYNPAIPDETGKTLEEVLPVYDDLRPSGKEKGSSHRTRVKTKTDEEKKTKAERKEKPGDEPGIFTKTKNIITSTTTRWIVGLFLGLFGVYLAVAFISYFSACVKDQSEINNTAIGYCADVANAAGEGGARLSEFLINEFFGVGSFVVIVWLVAIGLRMLSGRPKFKTLNFTIKCLVALITVSLVVGLVTIGMQSTVNWGGYHGRYVNEFIIHFLGWTGAVILGIFMVCCFIIVCMKGVVDWGLKKKAIYDEKRRIRKAELAEQRAREQELEEMRRAEDRGEHPDEDNEVGSGRNKPGEVTFGDDDSGLYSSIPDFEDTEFIYTLEEPEKPEKKEEISDSEEEEDSDAESSGENNSEGKIEAASESDDYSEDEVPVIDSTVEDDDSTENISGDKEIHYKDKEARDTDKERAGAGKSDDDLQMVVNVNQISQVSGKSKGIGHDSPEHFPYKFPSFDILAPASAQISVDPEEQLENKERIKRTLLNFGIPIVSIEATVGPTVTLYEIVPEKGIRVSKIKALVDDISRSLSAEQGVRIIAPIPGKETVGIEVPNKDKQTVSMRTVLKSPAFQQNKYKLPIALGSTISNEVFVTDLAKMPHLLVAGATGQGKSVGLNAIITSLLYSKRPDELKFVMIDPKMVEFSLYAKIEGHYLAKLPEAEDAIITDMDKVVATLNSLCIEMDDRYQLLKEAYARNIVEYNDKIKAKKLNPKEGHRFLPYIVVIVDEFSDLIMTAGKEVEMPIARLAQKARAVGIHVIVATQRPSTNVITGIIKANFPARIAFKVSSGVDSKTILDTVGAQQLIGRGDMLIVNGSGLVRVQCAFIDTPEVENIVDHIASQPYAQGAYPLPEPAGVNGEGVAEGGISGASGEHDPLFEEVARLVVQTNNASTSSIQRRYRIGYNRAGSIMDQLEAAGVVGPAQGGKPRAVLMDAVTLDLLLEN